MTELRENIRQMKEIVRELYVFGSQFEALSDLKTSKRVYIGEKEKKLLEDTINSLINQLKILNKSIPSIVGRISFYGALPVKTTEKKKAPEPLTIISYTQEQKPVSLVISDKDKEEFLENLSRSRLSIQQLKKKYVVKGPSVIGKPNPYAKLSNKFFRKYSNNFIANGYFKNLNRNLRKINSRFVLGTYVSMIFFTMLIAFILGIFLFLFLLFFDISFSMPFITMVSGDLFMRFFKFIGIVLVVPILSGFLLYISPATEAKNLGAKIDQELPFVTIHMSAIASSGVEPISIFKIILKGEEYKHTNIEFKKLMNLINFHGEDMVTALKNISSSTSSKRLRELLSGLAVTITSGGDLDKFLNGHAETLLFDYRLEREKYNKVSETFMDIYISVAIAAPMILLMIFVIIGSTGIMGDIFGLSTNALSLILILFIVLLNVFFLLFLKLKQPVI